MLAISLQPEWFLDALERVFFQISAMHRQHQLPAIQIHLQVRAFTRPNHRPGSTSQRLSSLLFMKSGLHIYKQNCLQTPWLC
jgi:hypothetical protein